MKKNRKQEWKNKRRFFSFFFLGFLFFFFSFFVQAGKININSATRDELCSLRGIGKSTAEKIIRWREENGPFSSVDELTGIRGIGEKKLYRIRGRLTTGAAPENFNQNRHFIDRRKGRKEDSPVLSPDEPLKSKTAEISSGNQTSPGKTGEVLMKKLSSPEKTGEVQLKSEKLKVYFINVGQGDATLFLFPGGPVILIDGGPGGAGRKKVVPLLKKLKIKTIDFMIQSHAHLDHVKGLVEVLNTGKFWVKSVWEPGAKTRTRAYRKFLQSIKNTGAQYVHVSEGVVLPIKNKGKIPIEAIFLNPPPKLMKGERSYLNSNSAVLKIKYGEVSFLMTGDMEKDTENRLLRYWKAELPSTVLKVAHHGSRFSTTAHFLKVVRPAYGIIHVGRGNSFGHPSPSTVYRLRQMGVEVFRTDRNGNIFMETDGKKLIVHTERGNPLEPVNKKSKKIKNKKD